jgi:hypothetical protein
MTDRDLAVNQIDQLEKRLASLHDLGVDTAALRSQLAFARSQVHEGRVAEALGICEEVVDTARKLADGSATPAERPRTGRFTRDQLAEAVKDLLSQGLLAKLMAEQRAGPDVRLEARLSELDERLRTYVGHEADALRAEQQVLREEMEQLRRSIGTVAATPFADQPVGGETAQAGKEPLWAARLHSILVKAIRRADAQAAQIAGIVQQLASQGALNPVSSGLTARVEALRSGIAEEVRSAVERVPAGPAAGEALEPAWSQQLATTLQTVAERLQTPVGAVSPAAEEKEPGWVQALREALDAVTTRLGAQPMTLVAEPPSHAEPAWAVALREALGAAETRHQEVIAALGRNAATADAALGERLAGAFERGLHDLGVLLAPRQMPAGPQPMDDSRSALSPVTVSQEDETRAADRTTTRTDRMPVDAEMVRSLVQRELETHLGSHGTLAMPKRDGTEQIRALVAAELDVRQGGAIERTGRSDLGDLRAAVLRLLPELLADETVRRSLFAVLALEAVSKPGVLGELTGLRAFLKRELGHAAEELATKLQPA